MKTLRSLLMALALLALYAFPVAADSHNCLDYESQAAAQDALRAEPSDPNGLDGPIEPTGDGILGVACDGYRGDYPDPAEDLVPVGTGTVGDTDDQDCEDFDSRAAAQAHLDADTSDPDNLDADNDGLACEAYDYPGVVVKPPVVKPPVVQPKKPNNQQSDDTVTKTFELTVNGTPPADAAFGVFYLLEGEDPDEEGTFVVLCGDISQLPPEERDIPEEDIVSGEACEGDGTVYSFEREFERGTRLGFLFSRLSVTDEETFEIFYTSVDDPSRIENNEDPLPEDFETLSTDFTNTAWYTFGGGAADDHQDDTQDDVQDDVQDDQQGEMPGEMPDTGAGGLGASVPWGTMGLAACGVLAAGYGVIRRR